MQPDSRHKAVAATAAMFFANGFAFATWVSRIPDIQAQLGLAPGPLGLAMLTIGGGALFSLQIGAKPAGKYGSCIVTCLMLMFAAITLAFIPAAHSFASLCLILALFGIFSSSMDIAMNAHAVAVQRKLDHPILSTMHALWSVGGVAGSATGSWLVKMQVAPQMHFVAAALVLLILAVVARPFLLSKNDEYAESQVGAGAPNAEMKIQENDSSVSPGGNQFIVMLAVLCFLAFMAEGAIADWSALYMENCLKASAAMAPLGFCAFSFAMSVGRFLGDFATKKFGADNLLRWGSLLAAVGTIAVVLIGQATFAIAGFVIAGLGMATLVPVIFSTAGDADKNNTAHAIGRVAVAGYLGLLIGPPMLGYAAQILGLQATLVAVSAIGFIVFLLAQMIDCNRCCFE